MKKILALLLAALTVLSLAACGAPSASDPSTAVIGKWELTATTPDGIKSVQYLEFNEDGTGSYLLLETGADGVETQKNYYTYEWTYEDGKIICVSEKYTDYYMFDAAKPTLTDEHYHGRGFKPVNKYKLARGMFLLPAFNDIRCIPQRVISGHRPDDICLRR